MYLHEIKEKYPLIYERVVLQMRSGRRKPEEEDSDVNNCLVWTETTEGVDFWNAVYKEEWNVAKDLYPELFIDKTSTNSVIPNGLFK